MSTTASSARTLRPRSVGMSAQEAAKLLGVNRHIVTDWRRRRGLPFFTVQKTVRFDREQLQAWMDQNPPGNGRRFIGSRPDDPGKSGIIYGLTDPRPEYAHKPIRYIGQTANLIDRRRAYESAYERGDAHSPALTHWFLKLKRMGLKFGFVQLDARLIAIGDAEREWITKGRKLGWSLLNCTDGGECTTWTDEGKKKASESGKMVWQREEYRERWLAAMKSRPGWGKRKQEREEEKIAARARHEQNKLVRAERRAAEAKAEAERKVMVFIPITHKGTAFIKLQDNRWALIDAEDWEKAKGYRWYANWHGTKWRVRTKRGGLKHLHEIVVGAKGCTTDTGDGLDCRKRNIKPARPREVRPRAPLATAHAWRWLQSTINGIVRTYNESTGDNVTCRIAAT